MVLVYAHITSPRLQYITDFIFHDLLDTGCRITIDSEEYAQFNGVKINYSKEKICDTEIHVVSHALLFEKDIRQQDTTCFTFDKSKAFFKSGKPDFPFDLFAASFYLISRYEEYLPHEKDVYGRYAHKQSLAVKEGFLNEPLVNAWAKQFAKTIQQKFPYFRIHPSSFSFLPTYDIDIAYSFKYKGLVRNLGGFLQAPSLKRLQVLKGRQKDPYDSYDWLHSIHENHNLRPHYFFLVAEKNGLYDKNILPHKAGMWNLIKRHAEKYAIGIHPSWQSGDQPSLLAKEKEQLEWMSGKMISSSRQHYIRFNLPAGFRQLITAGITDDYSMGYGGINGFRASVASSFYWYDLEKNEQTSLKMHPFCFMDANSFYEQHYTPSQALAELLQYAQTCREANGKLITIWHNNFLGTDPRFAGWPEIYQQFITGLINGDLKHDQGHA